MKKKITYFYGIDFLRWFAALIIVLYHYCLHFKIEEINYNQFLNYLVENREFGPHFVWLFWAISGFVFTNIYIHREVTLRKFFISRVARLYPLHFLTLIIVATLQFISLAWFNDTQESYSNDLYHFILHLFFASDWGFHNDWSFNTPVWSVSIEFPIYFLFFFTLIFLKKIKILYPIFMIGVFYYLFPEIVELINSDKLIVFNKWQNLAFFNFTSCIFYFFMGTFIYFCHLKLKKYTKLTLSFTSIIIIICLYLLNTSGKDLSFIPTTVLLFFSLILFAASLDYFFDKNSKRVISLGNTSYSIYLIHFPLQLVLMLLIKKLSINIEIFQNFLIFLLFLVTLQLISLISYKYFESPLRKIINSKYS